MNKRTRSKAELIGEAILLGLFVVTSATASLYMLDFIKVTPTAQQVTAYIMGGFATLVFGYICWKSVK